MKLLQLVTLTLTEPFLSSGKSACQQNASACGFGVLWWLCQLHWCAWSCPKMFWWPMHCQCWSQCLTIDNFGLTKRMCPNFSSQLGQKKDGCHIGIICCSLTWQKLTLLGCHSSPKTVRLCFSSTCSFTIFMSLFLFVVVLEATGLHCGTLHNSHNCGWQLFTTAASWNHWHALFRMMGLKPVVLQSRSTLVAAVLQELAPTHKGQTTHWKGGSHDLQNKFLNVSLLHKRTAKQISP